MEVLEKTDRCPDCQVGIGEPHEEGCDVARCLWDGGQRLSCDYALDYSDEPECDPRRVDPDDPHDCGKDAWTGYWPGSREAAEFGWWVYWDGPDPDRGWDYRGRGWVRVSADHPGARPDLNRIHIEAQWDREARRWVQR